ncbi:aminotransferase class I/II-fold pyridoxal phosphate-dependent enzyme [Clostridium intestinale]|uniref:Orn/Lys/Arg decarboxylase n=1 Tax=Clostridium intestinale URNW TaxID=1294142 RepID=U2NTR9_9CLOT|nr:aminotransferase class V-fold PLP-dependent enzyme [Clostridium intestinale]ERK32558.1 Orn/Lys/Arg decarboxylase [Clostridium intestinale URNW]
MNDAPIIYGLETYIKKNYAPFSMPGHKRGRAFQDELTTLILNGDITEVDGLDNLQNPQGIIREALDKLSECYGSYKSYFLVNGSTSGNLTMIFSSFNEGDKVLVERNCHKSIFNGILVRKLKPVYIKNEISSKLGAPLGIDFKHFLEIINNEKDIKGIILTYPNYFGIGLDISRIITECRSRSIKVLIDGAHGAHFGFHNELPESAVKLGADMVVMSAHKTLPSLTQTAYLHINNEIDKEKVEFYLSTFMSTSPSYLFMATLDYSRAFLQEKAEGAYEKLIRRIERINEIIDKVDGIDFIDNNKLEDKWIYDPTRIVISINEGYKNIDLVEYFLNNGVQAEMAIGRATVLIPTPFNSEEDFERLENALLKLRVDKEEAIVKSYDLDIEDGELIDPIIVMNNEAEFIDIINSVGKIAKEHIVPYPPGVPLILMGEKITKGKINKLLELLNDNIECIGVNNNKIKILKETEE